MKGGKEIFLTAECQLINIEIIVKCKTVTAKLSKVDSKKYHSGLLLSERLEKQNIS